MKKNSLILKPRTKLSLGDLILAVSSCTKDTKETVATVADLLGSGKVRLKSDGKFLREIVIKVPFDRDTARPAIGNGRRPFIPRNPSGPAGSGPIGPTIPPP